MVFHVTHSGHEPMTNHMISGHANHQAIQTQFECLEDIPRSSNILDTTLVSINVISSVTNTVVFIIVQYFSMIE